ncbi:hypothetical protein JB92DRAFT_2834078 [Gautieria morchelliformis]|nr:hypothetical protein JB92DRAFT_2834078 [Gautieria morchelliformis]
MSVWHASGSVQDGSEALWLAASVIAVLQLTGGTISTCYSYLSGVRNASRDKKRTPKKCSKLFVDQEDDETAASSQLPALTELLLRCRDELECPNTTLERDNGRKGHMEAVIWPLKESKVHKTLAKPGKLQDLLTAAIDVDQTANCTPSLLMDNGRNVQLSTLVKTRIVQDALYDYQDP